MPMRPRCSTTPTPPASATPPCAASPSTRSPTRRGRCTPTAPSTPSSKPPSRPATSTSDGSLQLSGEGVDQLVDEVGEEVVEGPGRGVGIVGLDASIVVLRDIQPRAEHEPERVE